MHVSRRTGPIPLLYYPDYRGTNPYQAVLYNALQPFVASNPGSAGDALERQISAESGTVIFHVHWEHQVLIDPTISVGLFLDQVAAFKDAGGKVIWTIHNLAPHAAFAEEDIVDLVQGMQALADVIHLHSLPALEEAQASRVLPLSKIRIIPHANYQDIYDRVEADSARETLGLSEARLVVLLPGRIAGYKDPQKTVEAFVRVADPADRLLIAGHFADGIVIDTLGDPRILLQEGFADRSEVSAFHAAADFVALPYVRSLTSGSAVLAATLGRGVLGPATSGLEDVVTSGKTGLLYDPEVSNSLETALETALEEGKDIWRLRGNAALRSAAARAPDIVAAIWLDVINGLVAAGPDTKVGDGCDTALVDE